MHCSSFWRIFLLAMRKQTHDKNETKTLLSYWISSSSDLEEYSIMHALPSWRLLHVSTWIIGRAHASPVFCLSTPKFQCYHVFSSSREKKKEGFTKRRNALHNLTLLQHSRRVGAYKTCTFLKKFPNCVDFKNWKWNMFTLLKTWFVFEAIDSTANYTFCNRYCRTWIALISFLVQQREPIKLISFPSCCRLIEDLARRCLV